MLHLAKNRSEDLVQLLSKLGSGSRDERGHQPAHEGSRKLGGPGVQQLVDHLHDVPEPSVPLLVPPLGNLLEGDRDVRSQTLTSVLERGKEIQECFLYHSVIWEVYFAIWKCGFVHL